MDKIFTSLLAGLLFFAGSLSAQQPTFTISPTTNDVQPDDIFEVDITVSDFENILSMQYGISWDSTIIEFQSVKNINSTSIPGFTEAAAFSTPNPGMGSNVPANGMGVSWFHPSFVTLNLPDGTVLFTLEFQAIGCGSSAIQFSGPPTPGIEILDGNFTNVGLNPVNATATVSGGDCGMMTPETTFSLTNSIIDIGEDGCVQMEVEGFENITDFSLSITYNENLLGFSSVENFNLGGLDAADFNTSTPGIITVQWSNASGISLADGTAIFDLCFSGIAAGTANLAFADTPVGIAVTNGDGESVDFTGSNGAIVVQDVQVILDLTNTTIDVGQTGCVDVRASDFENIGNLQLTINYNSTLLAFSSVEGINLPGLQVSDFNTSTPGVITVDWTNGSGVTEPDGTTIFELCFTGSASGTASLSFGGASTAATGDGTAIDFNGLGGAVIVEDIQVNLDLTNATVDAGQTGCVDVRAFGFENIGDLQLTINYNSALLDFSSVDGINLPGMEVSDFNTSTPGVITVSWSNGSGVTQPDGTTIFELCFTGSAAGTADLSFGLASSAATAGGTPITFDGQGGTVTVNSLNTDLTLTVESAAVDPGDNVCLALEIDNFEDIIGMSFTVSYDPAQLTYTGAMNLNSNLTGFSVAGNVGNPGPGFVTINWFENSLTPITLADGSVVLELCFDAVGSGTTAVEITSDIAAIEFSDINENIIPLVANDGTVTINGGPPPTGDLTLTVESAAADQGDNVCLALEIDNFEDLIGMSFTVSYDPAQLSYTGATNLNGNLTGFSVAGNVGNPSPGFVTVNWFENSLTPVTLPDGSVILELCFDAVGSGTTEVDITSDIASIEFSDVNEDIVPLVANNGTVTINGGPPPTGDLTLTVESATADQGDNVCLALEIDNFEDLIGMSFTISYDAAQLSYTGATNLNGNLPGFSTAGNVANPSPGFVTVNWFENSLTPVTLADGSVILELCFDAVGSGTTAVEVTSDVAAIEFSDLNEDIIPLTANNGTVSINGGPPSDDLTLSVGNANTSQGETVCVPVTVDNFTDLIGMSFTVSYDESLLTFVNVQNLTGGLPGFAVAGNIGNPGPGQITVNWFENSLSPTTLPNGTVLFEICFEALGGGSAAVGITSEVAAIEFSDVDENVIPPVIDNGTITISDDPTPDGLLLTIDDQTIDPGDQFCTSVKAFNFEGVVGMSFTISYNPSVLTLDDITSLTSNLPGFSEAANIGTPNNGFVTVNWFENSLTPTDLADGEVLFDLCFTANGSGVTSDVAFTSDIAAIEFSDANEDVIPFSSDPGTITFTGMASDLTLTAGSLDVEPAGSFCVPVTVQNFEDIVGMSFTINYDAAHLSLDEITSLTPNLPGFNQTTHIGTPGDGFVTVNWFENSLTPTTLPDNEVLFELCFTALGVEGSCSNIEFSSDIAAIEFSDINENVIPAFLEEGTICVEEGVPGQLQLEVGDAAVDLDAEICVPVTVEAFTEITDFSFTLEYDADELQFENISSVNSMLPNFTAAANIDTSTPGVVSISWSGSAATLADGAVLFDLCFTAIGTEDTCSDIIITGSDEPISFTSSSLGMLSFSGEEGTICINAEFDGFRLSVPDRTVQPGEQFCVPVNVLNFQDVVGFAFTINYDETQLSFQNINSLNPAIPDFSLAGNFGLPSQIGAGNISVNWFSQSIIPVGLANGEALFEMCFTVIGDDGDVSDIVFSSDITPIEVSDSNGDVIPFNSLPGTITVSEVQPPNIAQADVVNVDCFGEATGAISLTVNGGTGGPYSYIWDNDATSAAISGLTAGSYAVTVTDMGNNGLTATASYTVDGPPAAVSVNGGVTAPTCAEGTNGSINLNITGGNPGYTINWDSGIQSGQTNPSNLPGGTYCVTVTDDNGCIVENCYNVPNGTGSGATLTPTVVNESCADSDDGSISLSVTGAVGTANFFWSPTPGVPGSSTLDNLAPGSYSVTVIDDASCQSTASFEVEEASPINLFQGITDVSCAGESTGVINLAVSGGNGGFSYDWSGPNNFSANVSLVSNLVSGEYTVVVTDANNCTATESFMVNEPDAPLSVQNIDPTPIDQGVDGTVALQAEGGTMPYTYNWSGPDNFSSSASNLDDLSVQGEYCVTITDANDCTTTACVTVEQVLRINSDITDACFGEANGSVVLNVDGGIPPYTYEWTGVMSTGPQADSLAAGSYSVTVTDSDGEIASMSFIVEESPEIMLASVLVPVTGAASNTNGSIVLNPSGGSSPLTYQWSGPDSFTSTDPNISNLGTGEYCVTITDSNFNNNCTKDTCFNVYFAAPIEAPNVTATGTSCSYTEDGSLEVQINGGVPNFSIVVTDATGQMDTISVSGNSFTVEDLPAGSTTILITDLLGAEVTSTVSISSPAPLQVSEPDYRHASEGNCNGQASISVSGGTPPYNISWNNGSNGTSIGNLCPDQWYVPAVTDANGCTIEVDSVFINNFDVQIGSVSSTSCPDDANGSIDINVSGGDPAYTFVWNNANGNQVASVEDPTDLVAGTYTLIITEASGNTLSRQVTIETESTLQVTLSSEEDYNGFDVSCANAADGALSASATGSSGYLYEWTDLETSMLIGTGQEVENLPAGTYQLMVQDEIGCTATNQIELVAPDSIDVQAFVQNVQCHDGRNGAITVNANSGVEPYNFFWNNGGFGNRITELESGPYTVTVLDDNNCQQSADFEVLNPDPITVAFETEPATEGCNGSVLAIAEGGSAPYTYNWEQSDNQGEELFDLCFGEYFLQVRDRNGCLSELTSVSVEDRRFPCFSDRIILTPDNDGANEEFIILCVNEFPDNHLQIFNRWGQLVFEADNYDNTWNGITQDGAPLPEGPYYYVLDYTDPEGNPRQQRGSLTILRED